MTTTSFSPPDISGMTIEELRAAYLDLLRRYEAADDFRQRAIDSNCTVEKVNQAIQERGK